MNVTGLLRHLQREHDEAAAQAAGVRRQIDDLSAALCEAEALLAEPALQRRLHLRVVIL